MSPQSKLGTSRVKFKLKGICLAYKIYDLVLLENSFCFH